MFVSSLVSGYRVSVAHSRQQRCSWLEGFGSDEIKRMLSGDKVSESNQEAAEKCIAWAAMKGVHIYIVDANKTLRRCKQTVIHKVCDRHQSFLAETGVILLPARIDHISYLET